MKIKKNTWQYHKGAWTANAADYDNALTHYLRLKPSPVFRMHCPHCARSLEEFFIPVLAWDTTIGKEDFLERVCGCNNLLRLYLGKTRG